MIEKLKQNIIKEFTVELSRVFKDVERGELRLDVLNYDIKKRKDDLNTLNKNINDKESIIDKLDKLIQNKQIIHTEIIELKNKLKKEQCEYNILLEHNKGIIKDLENRINKLKKELKKQTEIILPTVKDLNQREKDIKEKENDLLVIQKRWKRIYQDKGVGFKI